MKTKPIKEKSVDRRIQKTKRSLSEAFVSLIVKKGYDAVSIKDIINKANIGRSTFYSHFENKEQLLLSGHDTFKRLLTEKKSTDVDINFLFLYQHVQEQNKLTNALIGKRGGEIIQNQLHAIFAHRIAEYFGKDKAQKSDAMFTMQVNAAASAMVTLLAEWMKNGMSPSPEEMAAQSEKLLLKMMS